MAHSWPYKTVTIMGFGLYPQGSGIEAAKFCLNNGSNHLILTDLRPKKIFASQIRNLQNYIKKNHIRAKLEWRFGGHDKQDFHPKHTDCIVKNPAIHPNSPFLRYAAKENIPVVTDMMIFFTNASCPIIGITGTRGKSTTSKMIYEMLKSAKKKATLGGNIMISPLQSLPTLTKKHTAVIELPAQQLYEFQYIKKNPHISIITNIFPDHYNFYGSKQKYIREKKRIFEYQNSSDHAIANYDNSGAKKIAAESRAQHWWYSLKTLPENLQGAFLHGHDLYFQHQNKKQKILPIKAINLRGKHNISNSLAAICAARILKIPFKKIRETLRKFQGLPYRIQLIKKSKGISYINDSASTTPEAAIAALKTVREEYPSMPIFLIAGGVAKVPNYRSLAAMIHRSVRTLLLLPGSASEKITRSTKPSWKKNIIRCDNLAEAMKRIETIASKPCVLLFSPGAASFNQFNNEVDRAEQFNSRIK